MIFKKLSVKQQALWMWYEIRSWLGAKILIATGAIRTGKTVIGSYAFLKYSMRLVRRTDAEHRTKGYNLFAVVSVSKSLAYLNIIEPWMNRLEVKGFKEVESSRDFKRAKGNVFIQTGSPMGMLEVKDHLGNVTRFLYIGADNKRAMNRVTGLTLRGWMLDEAPLLGGNEEDNIKFIERMIERTATFKRPLQMMTTNPQTGEDGLFYQTYIKGAWHKGIVVLSFWLLDNPEFDEDDVEYYRKIFTLAQFMRKVMGKWVRDNENYVYPKFKREIHVVPAAELEKIQYDELSIGLDEGQRDARAFVLAGFYKNYNNIAYLGEYYHKNKEGVEPKDVNEYVADFFNLADIWHRRYQKHMTVYVDSAALALYVLLKKAATIKRITYLTFIPVNKAKTDPAIRSAIDERIDFTNMLLGSERVLYSEKVPKLIDATSKAIKKEGKRIDDGKTNNVDSLDASEYAVKHRLKHIVTKIMRRGRNA